jgi:adenosine deaminase CECR1
VQLGRNSLTYSFAQPEVKARLLADYEQAVTAFEKRFAAKDSLAQLATVKPVTYGYAQRTWGLKFQ